MSGDREAVAGTCRSCGRDLVQVLGERTYHPAAVLGPEDSCPALLPIPGTDVLSGNVPDVEFVPAQPTADAGGASLTDAERRDLGCHCTRLDGEWHHVRFCPTPAVERILTARASTAQDDEGACGPCEAAHPGQECGGVDCWHNCTAQDEGAGEVERLRVEVEALAERARGASRFYRHMAGPSAAFESLAADLRAVVDRAKGGA